MSYMEREIKTYNKGIKSMKVLIVIHALNAGGAEKSLISLLEALKIYKLDIDLLVAWKTGMYMDKIPENVRVLETPENLRVYATPMSDKQFPRKIHFYVKKILCQIEEKVLIHKSDLHKKELLWKLFSKNIEELPGNYDLAISYMHGFPNYYVIDKVCAKRKILWMHNDYEKQNLCNDFERNYFQKAKNIVTISEACACSLRSAFPDLQNKFIVLENISSSSVIRKLSMESFPEEYLGFENGWKLLSIGRLHPQKGFDIAIKAAKKLKEEGVRFKWYIIGSGSLKKELRRKCKEYGVEENMLFLGQRTNPYVYIKNCDIFVQPSRYEGKSIVLDEAKILCKPIVVTNYPTVVSSIEKDKNGIIVDIDKDAIAKGIISLIEDNALREHLIENLEKEDNGNDLELKKYYHTFIGSGQDES